MSRLTAYHYAVLTRQQADDNAGLLLYGTRVSNDDSEVIAKLPTTVGIEGISMLPLASLLDYINNNPTLWADPL